MSDAKIRLIECSRLQRAVNTEDFSEPEWMSSFIDCLLSVGTRQILVPNKAAEKSAETPAPHTSGCILIRSV